MTHISTICVLGGALAVVALSATGASAATITVRTPMPTVHLNVNTRGANVPSMAYGHVKWGTGPIFLNPQPLPPG
jgi:hypothetical protein